MRLFKTIVGLRSELESQWQEKKIGLVPTMGALHAGHVSLIQRAVSENDFVVVSIFINPLQFSPHEDLEHYPRQLDKDLNLCEQLGVDLVFAPLVSQLYGQTSTTQVVPPTTMTSVLCGQSRPGHFEGVATVVTKLLNIVQPTIAYFGEKDGQQLAIIKRLVEDLNLNVEVRACPIVREDSGLAYSSRNQYLTPQEKEQALVLSRSLGQAEQLFRAGEFDTSVLVERVTRELALVPEIEVEYVELVHPSKLIPLTKIDEAGLLAIACRIGSTRLIDNVILRQRQPIIAIDGPAGAGKSTVTRRVAHALGLLYLDTGAMYRAITWLVLQSGISFEDQGAIAELVSQAQIKLIPGENPTTPVTVEVNGYNVTQVIRSGEVTAKVSVIAAQSSVRRALVKQQQLWGCQGGVIAEGRDIGTHVFPDAELKIFLTASVQERARRRWQDLTKLEKLNINLQQLEQDIQERDRKDSTRKLAPLQKSPDAIEIITDALSIEEVINQIIHQYNLITN